MMETRVPLGRSSGTSGLVCRHIWKRQSGQRMQKPDCVGLAGVDRLGAELVVAVIGHDLALLPEIREM